MGSAIVCDLRYWYTMAYVYMYIDALRYWYTVAPFWMSLAARAA